MSTERTKQILGVDTSKVSVNTDTFLTINLNGKERLLPPDEINHVVNAGERFDFERQRSKYYRILGTINPTASNALFNLTNGPSDIYTWAEFNQFKFIDQTYPKDNLVSEATDLTYSQSINKYLLEVDGWFGYNNPDVSQAGLCSYFDMEPKRERFSFVPDITTSAPQPVKNWELTVTYPKTMDKTHPMVNGGLLIVDAEQAFVSTREVTSFSIGCLHNLNIGDMVTISGANGYNGEHVVIRTGSDTGDLKPYIFVIDMPFTANTVSGSARFKRMFGGVASEYYFRKFRKIKTKGTAVIETDDYETYPLAFSENIFTDSISQFVFNEDIDVSDLTDNLDRPITDIYLSVIKTSSDGIFSKVSSGIETPFYSEFNNSGTKPYLRDIPVINKIHNGTTLPFIPFNALEDSVTINNNNSILNNNDFYGDLVEYNSNEVKETILAEVAHRFNTANRETAPTVNSYSSVGTLTPTRTLITLGPRQEGYFYKAHYRTQIKELSSYVEIGDEFTEGIPDYATPLPDGRFVWRDILDIGINESNEIGLSYPFLNGAHYLYNNYCVSVRRQDPFDNWNLFYGTFPSDPIGERITDKFTTNSAEDIC